MRMYDAIIIGGGHAGAEAALALARLGKHTLLISGNLKMMASMPCNPSIGGPAKGTLVREIDALGGEMGKNADRTALQMKMLNRGKGPAVRALRVQSDKVLYPRMMQEVLASQVNLELLEAYVKELVITDDTVGGVRLEDGRCFESQVTIITTGTFMEGAILVGDTKRSSGPDNERPSIGLSANLRRWGIPTFRLKTGTPPRVWRDSVDFSQMTLSPGDGFIHHFSHDPDVLRVLPEEWPCHLIHTTPLTHQIIHENIRRSALFGGLVEGVGPRYCPSIEDKLVKFSDKERHQLFIEPESASIDQVYLQGFSTSMPHEVQELMVHSLPGLSQARIAKYAYAIEYDAIDPTSLKPTLESKIIHRLFFAGQVNGTSGYEEAAAQGLMAGINAYLLLEGRPHFVLRRDEAYIGVLIDDLVTKGTKEPYRMLTSRAEFRLLLRHDNADLRLSEHGYRIGLLPIERYMRFTKKKAAIEAEYQRLCAIFITPSEAIRNRFSDVDIPAIKTKTSLTDVLKRPDIDHEAMRTLFPEHFTEAAEIYEQIEIEVKYEGYIQKAIRETEKLKKEELIALPEDIDYHKITNLALEARSKLQAIRPLTIGQASRISGVNPADIQTLLIYLRSRN